MSGVEVRLVTNFLPYASGWLNAYFCLGQEWYLPKGSDLSVYSQEDLDAIADSLNSRPRATHGFNSPAVGTMASTCAITRSPPGLRSSPRRNRCSGPGMSANGAPLRSAPGFLCSSGM